MMKVTKRSNYAGFNIQKPENYIRDIDNDVKQLTILSQGRTRFGTVGDGDRGENIAGEWRVLSYGAIANSETPLAHTLSAVPQGFIVVNLDQPGILYSGGTTWTTTTVYLKSTTTTTDYTVFLIK